MKLNCLILILLIIPLVSASPTINIFVRPLEPGASIEYTFNITSTMDCDSGALISHNEIVTMDSTGIGLVKINITNLNNTVPERICVFKDGSLLSNLSYSNIVFNSVWAKNFIGNNLTIENIDVSEDIVLGGDITGPFGNFTDLIAGGFNISDINNTFLAIDGSNAITNVNISPYSLLARGVILNDGTCLDFGDRSTSICESGTGDIDILSVGRIDVWTQTEISLRVDGDVNDYFHIETNDDIPTLRSYLSNMILLPDEGLVTVKGNLTADWFKGKWNGTSPNDWIIMDGSSVEFNSSNLDSIYHNATQSNAVVGTIDGGTLSDTQHQDALYDGVTFNFSEEVGSPGLELYINFTGLAVETFNRGIMRYKTSALSGDYPLVQMWNYDDSVWEDYPQLIESDTFATMTQPVFDGASHIQDGVAQMRIYKAGAGKTQNHYYIDWIAIVSGVGLPIGQEGDPVFNKWLHNTSLESNVSGYGYSINNISYLQGDILNFTTAYIGNVNVSGVLQDFDSNVYAKYQFIDNNFNGSGNWSGTAIKADHIAEKTPGHNVVFDNDVVLGANDLTTTGSISAGAVHTSWISGIGVDGSAMYPFPATQDLGIAMFPWKDLHLSGDANIGGDAVVTGDSYLGNWTINESGQFYNNDSRTFSIEINSTHTKIIF